MLQAVVREDIHSNAEDLKIRFQARASETIVAWTPHARAQQSTVGAEKLQAVASPYHRATNRSLPQLEDRSHMKEPALVT